MQKARSPQYPAIGLKEAVDKIGAVYANDYQNAVPRAVVAQHMGYQGLNGKSLGVLSALSKFGLLEGRGDETRVSDLAVQIIAHPTGTTERAKAITEAAAKPELFKELDGQFQGKVSDQALRSYLITQKFIPAAADAAIRAYRETKALVEAESNAYDSGAALVHAARAPTAEGHSMLPGNESTSPFASGAPPMAVPAPLAGVPISDPFRVMVSPSGRLEGSFLLNRPEDLDALVTVLQAMKFVFKMAEDIKMAGGPHPGTPYPDGDQDAN